MYVLDTNAVIDFIRGQGEVAERLKRTPRGQVALSVVSAYELFVGVENAGAPARRRRQIETFVGGLRVLDFEPADARVAARLRAALEAAGTPIGPLDSLIAASALRQRATLVTHNVDEVARVPGLQVDDWR